MAESKTLAEQLGDVRAAFRLVIDSLPLDWFRRNAWWLRYAAGFYLASLGVYLIVIDEPISVGLVGLVLVYFFWPRRRRSTS